MKTLSRNHFWLYGLLLLSVWMWSKVSVASTEAPQIRLKPTVVSGNSQKTRTIIKIEAVSASSTFAELRCYFRQSSTKPWLFTKASWSSADTFDCQLPIMAADIKVFNFLITALDDKNRIIRTVSFVQDVKSVPDERVPLQLTPLAVYDEIGVAHYDWIDDPNVKQVRLSANDELSGLIAGLYLKAQIPAYLGAREGYFGGYEYSQEHNVTYPVRGYALGLNLDTGAIGSLFEVQRRAEFSVSVPNVGGNDWSGYFGTTGSNNRLGINSSVNQSNNNITLFTSKPGIASYFIGTINSSGHMLLYDQYDGEDWTTHLGPATDSSIRIYDFIRPPSASEPNPPLNYVELSRVVIKVPESLSISVKGGNVQEGVEISWSNISNADYYLVYRCITPSANSCTLIKQSTSNTYVDTPPNTDVYYFRVRACNSAGCSTYSVAQSGKLQAVSITGALMLLLL